MFIGPPPHPIPIKANIKKKKQFRTLPRNRSTAKAPLLTACGGDLAVKTRWMHLIRWALQRLLQMVCDFGLD
jgi:hypothetical protein